MPNGLERLRTGAPLQQRRRFLGLAAACLLPFSSGCASRTATVAPWQKRLRGDTVALLGEVHDNAEDHRLRAHALRDAVAAGWRPAVVMEQFDLDRQQDIERSRQERPRDARHLIEAASPPHSGWEWSYYEPVIAMVLDYDLPLWAGNLPRAEAGRIVKEGYEAVLGEARVRELGLGSPVDPAWQAAQEREIDAGHCGALPPEILPRMARAQFARDAVMAHVMLQQAAGGVVLLAGNGHVRRDIGVPRWLEALPTERCLAVGFIEAGHVPAPGEFDAVVVAPAAERGDPCREFRLPRGT